jgi:hypothetical protein
MSEYSEDQVQSPEEDRVSSMNSEDLLKALITQPEDGPETAEVDVKRGGKLIARVTVRGLFRQEALRINKMDSDKNPALVEQKLLNIAMINPRMSEKDVAAWQSVAPARELDPVVKRINELSGMTEDATKSGDQSSDE